MSTTQVTAGRSASVRLALLFALVLVPAILVTACGSSSDDSSDDTSAGSSESASSGEAPEWCGDEPITIGIQDGGGINAWSAESLRQVKLEAEKCPAIEDQIVVNAAFDPQKAVSGLQGMVAQGANAIVVIPDAGVCAELPAMRQATQRGTVVVPWGADGCGEDGTDYLTYVNWNEPQVGGLWADWISKEMGDKGNLVYLGGPPGNPVDQGHIQGLLEGLADHPEITVLENLSEDNWPVTNWDPAEAQKVMTSLIGKYPEIDGIVSSSGEAANGAVRALEAAGRPVPPIATIEVNELACAWKDAQGTPEEFDLMTVSSRNWLGRIAVRKAVAEVNGLEDDAESIVDLPVFEDSTEKGKEPNCQPDEDPSKIISNYEYSDEEIEELTHPDG